MRYALLLALALLAAPALAAGPLPTPPPITTPVKPTPGPRPTPTPAVELAYMAAAWQGHDLLVTWVGDGTELVLLQQDGTYALLATVPGEYTVKGSGVDVNVVPHPGDVLVVHGRDGQLLAYLRLGGYPIVPRAILPVVVR